MPLQSEEMMLEELTLWNWSFNVAAGPYIKMSPEL